MKTVSKRLIVGFALGLTAGLALHATQPARAETPSKSALRSAAEKHTRIVGGEPAVPGSWPWQVALVKRGEDNFNGQFCGGSLIHPKWVLSAAHCFEGGRDAGDFVVLEDTSDLRSGGRRIPVKRVLSHARYNGKTYENDIALLELTEPAHSQPARLVREPAMDLYQEPGVLATVTGWGLLRPIRETASGYVDELSGKPVGDTSELFTSRLMQVDLPLVSTGTCRTAYPGAAIDERQLCAGLRRGGKDSCQGDSGGPLVVQDGAGDYLQAGVVSWGMSCAKPGKYGVYTRASRFAGWIEEQAGIRIVSAAAQPVAPAATQPVDPPPAEPEPPAVDPPPPAASVPKGNRALLVGIDRYQSSDLDLVGGSANDAALMQDLLIRHWGFRKDQIQVLLNGEATKARILGAMDDWLVGGTRPGDRVVFSYSGHGYYQDDKDGDEDDPYDEVLVPHDAALSDEDANPAVFDNLISDDEVGERLARLADRQVMLVIDSCHSGTMTRTVGSGDPRYVRTLALRLPRMAERAVTRSALRSHQRDESFIEASGNLTAWSAVSPLQQALVDRETDDYQGVFTGRFKRGLEQREADDNGDGLVTFAELHDYLQRESDAYCKRNRNDCSAGLTPYLEASSDALSRDVVSGQRVTQTAAQAESVLTHDNRAGVRVEILPRSRVRLGQEMAFRVTSQRPGYLLVLDIGTSGAVTQLYPNRIAEANGKDNRIRAGGAVTIPDVYYGFRFTAGEPTGAGRLLAIVTEDPISLDDLTRHNKDLAMISDPEEYLGALAERLRQPWSDGNGNRTAEWSMSSIDYLIEP